MALREQLKLLPLVILAALLAGEPAMGQQNPPPKIVDIIVLGNKNVNKESIITASGLKIGDPLTQQALDEAKRRVMQMGFWGSSLVDPADAVKVTAEITEMTAKVVIQVVENDQVSKINITGNGPVPETVIRGLVKTEIGKVLHLPTLTQDVARIKSYYEDKGYQAYVSEDLRIENGVLDIPIVVGKIGAIKLSGLHKTKPRVILRELRSKPGQYYNITTLRGDLTALLNLDLFENVEPAFAFPKAGQVDVTLNITEKRTGQIELAAGYGTRGIVGRVGVSENNFRGLAQQISIQGETGGRANQTGGEFSFTEPWLDRRHTSLSLSVFDKPVYRFAQRIGSDVQLGTPTDNVYFETHTGAQVTVSRPFSRTFRGFVGFRYDNVRVPLLTGLQGVDQRVLQNGPLTTVNLRMTHNTRDFDLEPAAGGYEIYTGDIGRADLRPVTNPPPAGGIFGVLNYTKYGVDARRYFSPQGRRKTPKDKRSVFALRLMIGASSGNLPFSELYFVGGAESLRGYNEDRFWGTSMMLGSVEYRHPLAQSLTGVLFADAGDAWGGAYETVKLSGFDQHSGFSPSVGFGLGLRIVTPIGPIRIDEGFGREGAHTHFSIGHVF